jgi:hypothetical protein
MISLLLFICFYVWFAFWSAQAGFSIHFWGGKLQNWQNKIPLGKKIPELVLAASIASIGLYVWSHILPDLQVYTYAAMWFGFALISYLGKESATVGYLEWEGSTKDENKDGVVDNKDARRNTLAGWNQFVSGLFGWKNGDEGYSWVWAFTKGLITTLPLFCLGTIFQPIGREMASHAEGRLKGDPNFYMEAFGDGFGYAASSFIAIKIVLLWSGV